MITPARTFLLWVLPALILVAGCASSAQSSPSATTHPTPRPHSGAPAAGVRIAYPSITGGVAVVTLDARGKAAATRTVATPWTPTSVGWSPDGSYLSFRDDNGRLGIIDLATGGVQVLLPVREQYAGVGTQPLWSPNGRYLAYAKLDESGQRASAPIWLWDRSTGSSRLLVPDAATVFASAAWAHDSRRLAVAVGANLPYFPKAVNPAVRVYDVTSGAASVIAHGTDVTWSPDDRFLALAHIDSCFNISCYETQEIIPSSGGAAAWQGPQVVGYDANGVWQRNAAGYEFDRWVLDAHGHEAGSVGTDADRLDAWAPGGEYAALEPQFDFNAGQLLLSVQRVGGSETRVYADGPARMVGTMRGNHYTVLWARDARMMAFVAPSVLTPSEDTLAPVLGIAAPSDSGVERVITVVRGTTMPLAFIDRDQTLIFAFNQGLYAYDVPHGDLREIVHDLGVGQYAYGPSAIAVFPAQSS